MNSFVHFAATHRPAMRVQCPDVSMKDIAKLLGKQWRDLSDEEKETCRAMAVAEKKTPNK